MKRYILMLLCCLATIMMSAQYPDCIEINEFSPTISRWGSAYQPVSNELECWIVDIGVQAHVKITYNIDLELVSASDQVIIYELDANNVTTRLLRSFFACSTSGSMVTSSATGKVKIEYWGYYGNCGGLYNGFQIRVEQATCCDLVNNDHYILGKLGVGTTTPQEMLHVNGAIRGGGTNGEVTLKGSLGSVTIGATDEHTLQFSTDRHTFLFNKPISGSGTNGGLKLYSSIGGSLEFGPIDYGIVRFKTNMDKYHFDKDVTIGTGVLSSSTSLTFRTNNSTNGMKISLNGNVGIGTSTPQYKLDVAGTIRAEELIVETTGADFVFAEDYQLRPLSEVKAFIDENKHLPEIQSAEEMQENGVSVSELQTQLLQKIEELTLYILQQEEKIKQQEARIKALEVKR